MPGAAETVDGTAEVARSPSLTGRLLSLLTRDTNIVAGTVIFNNLLRIVSSMVLTRILAPEIFGVTGIILTIIFAFTMISDLGFQAFVVRHEDGAQKRFRDTIWTIRLIRGAVLTVVMALLAHPIALILDKPQIGPAIAFASLMFVLESMSSLTVITALREQQLGRLSLMEMLAGVGQLLISVALVLLWPTLWAILTAMLLSSAFKSALSYIFFPDSSHRPAYEARYGKELWAFARYVTGSSSISMLLNQGDKFVFARLLPLHSLGLYVLASNLALAPLAFTSAYASRVLYPQYAALWRERPEALRAFSYAKRRMVSLLYCFAVGGLIGGAGLVIGILYDERYAYAAIYLQILAISPLLALSSMAANEVLTASGRVQVTFHANIARLAYVCLLGPLAFIQFGAFGLICIAGTLEVPTLLYSWWQLSRVKMLDLPQEMLFLLAAVIGAGVGRIVEMVVLPLI